MDKVFYNRSSSKSLGWKPSWFGVLNHDDELVEAIAAWQSDNGITADGLCGPSTYRRIWTDREVNISKGLSAGSGKAVRRQPPTRHIVHNGNFYPIDWDVVLWDKPYGLSSKQGSYYDYSGKEDRNPSFFVNHWDAALSSESCARILKKRGISVHFAIDNDGTIYQLLDTQHAAFHAGSSKWNRASIGVEITNAFYPKYQKHYESKGFGPRPVVTDAYVHGNKLEEHLGFYQVQLDAAKALWKAVSVACDIPLVYPEDSRGNLDTGVNSECKSGKFEGFCNHYNLTSRKIDCAGLQLDKLINEVKNG